jgi:hypothetical protein
MQEKPEIGLGPGLRIGLSGAGRARGGDILRRKLIRKMLARRDRRPSRTIDTIRRST